MSYVKIDKVHEGGHAFRALIQQADNIYEKIRNRAFELFKRRGEVPGFDLDDWFKAEQDFLLAPEAELLEKDGNFDLKIAVPGFEEKELTVTALPDALVVTAESEHKHSDRDGAVEFAEKKLYRRINFPAPIDPDKVEATLDKGMLTIMVPRMSTALVVAKTMAVCNAA